MAKGQIIHGALQTVSRSVPNAPVRSVRYEDGVNPYGMLARASGAGTLGDLSEDAPTKDGPTQRGAVPDKHGKSKADEVAAHDPSEGLGVNLAQGPLSR
jgi:hypothetical protein